MTHPLERPTGYFHAKYARRPYPAFEARVNGCRPGPCRQFFALFGWGGGEFYQYSPQGGLVMAGGPNPRTTHAVRVWRFGRVTIRPISPAT